MTVNPSKLLGEGFYNLKRTHEKLVHHETSKVDVQVIMAFSLGSRKLNQIYRALIQQAEEVAFYWRNVL